MIKIKKDCSKELIEALALTHNVSDHRIKVIEKDIREELENDGNLFKDTYVSRLTEIRKICSSAIDDLNKLGAHNRSYDDYTEKLKETNEAILRISSVDPNATLVGIDTASSEYIVDNTESESSNDAVDESKVKKTASPKKVTSKKKIEFEDSVNTEEAEIIAKNSKPLEVKNVAPKDEPTYEEIRNEIEVAKQEKPLKNVTPVEEIVSEEQLSIEEDKDDIKPANITSIPKPKKKEEAKAEKKSLPIEHDIKPDEPALEIETEKENIIVVSSEPKKSEVEDEEELEEEELYDANGYKSEGPLVNEDNSSSTEDLNDIEIVDKEEILNSKKEEIEDDDDFGSSSIDSDKILYNTSKTMSRKRINPMIQKLSNLDTSKYDVGKISVFDFDGNDEEFRKEYITSRNNMMAAPRVSRVSLLMSGHYEEISAYGNWDFASISRQLSDKDVDFVDRELFLYNSIYSHVMFVSYSKSVPDFETWAKHIYYPDVNSLFFGVYDANSVGVNNYVTECPKCGKEIVVPRENSEIAVAISNVFSKDDLDKIITYKDIMKQDFSPMYKWAKETSVRQQLNNTKYIVDYGVPTLYDYLTTIATLRRISVKQEIDVDISSVENWADPDVALRIYHYMYIKRLGIPSIVKDTHKIKYIGLTSKADIIEFLNALDVNDYSQLINAPEVSEFITKSACDFYIEDAKCDDKECGHVIKHLLFNPKRAFFFKIGEVRQSLK